MILLNVEVCNVNELAIIVKSNLQTLRAIFLKKLQGWVNFEVLQLEPGISCAKIWVARSSPDKQKATGHRWKTKWVYHFLANISVSVLSSVTTFGHHLSYTR